MPVTLTQVKLQWNEILDLVERENRIVWLAYFDARLVSLDDNVLKIDFVDSAKLAGAHDYSSARKASLLPILESAIKTVTGHQITVVEL